MYSGTLRLSPIRGRIPAMQIAHSGSKRGNTMFLCRPLPFSSRCKPFCSGNPNENICKSDTSLLLKAAARRVFISWEPVSDSYSVMICMTARFRSRLEALQLCNARYQRRLPQRRRMHSMTNYMQFRRGQGDFLVKVASTVKNFHTTAVFTK